MQTIDLKQCTAARGTRHHWVYQEQGESGTEFSLARCKHCHKVRSGRNWLETFEKKWGSK